MGVKGVLEAEKDREKERVEKQRLIMERRERGGQPKRCKREAESERVESKRE